MTATLIKALAVLIITAGLIVTFGAQKNEYAFLLSLACSAVVIISVLDTVLPQLTFLKSEFLKAGGAGSYFAVALKALGISYITGFVADTCRDFGQSALAAKAELAGKCAIFILCVPPAVSVLETALKFAGI